MGRELDLGHRVAFLPARIPSGALEAADLEFLLVQGLLHQLEVEGARLLGLCDDIVDVPEDDFVHFLQPPGYSRGQLVQILLEEGVPHGLHSYNLAEPPGLLPDLWHGPVIKLL